MKKSKKILFFGNERIATATETKALVFDYLSDNYNVCALVVSEKKFLDDLEVVKIAKTKGIEYFNYAKLKDHINEIADFGADIAVLISYGKIIPQSIIDLFPLGIINLHPSLLPKHRGPTPIESVILSGEKDTGVSLMSLSKEMDAGPVFIQKHLALDANEDKQTLANKLDGLGLQAFTEVFDKILNSKISANEQNNSMATYDNLLKKSDSIIDWSQSSEDIYRRFRAYKGWPGVKTQINGISVKINSMKISNGKGNTGEYILEDSTLRFFTSDGSIDILELQPDGKKVMNIKEFLNGYRSKI